MICVHLNRHESSNPRKHFKKAVTTGLGMRKSYTYVRKNVLFSKVFIGSLENVNRMIAVEGQVKNNFPLVGRSEILFDDFDPI